MLRYIWLICVCTVVLAQDGCDPCDDPLSPTVEVLSVSGAQAGSNPNANGILLDSPGPDNLYTTSSGKLICFVIKMTAPPGSHMDLCSVSLSTRFASEVNIDCGGGQNPSKDGLPATGIVQTTLDLNIGDDDCVPDSATATCELCVTSPTQEPTIFGFDVTACECCVDCEMNNWGPWGECSVTCESGVEKRTRTVKVQPNSCGDPCPPKEETRPCEISKVDCEVSEWTPWGECSKTCETGVQSRSRTITQQPNECGDACDPLTETRSCEPVIIDCEVSEWTPWGECSKTCETGVQSRSRTITQQPNCDDDCGPLTETRSCEPVIIECVLDTWGEWGACDTSPEPCGEGVTTRSRNVLIPPNECGAPCPVQVQTMSCNEPCCPEEDQETIDCANNKDQIASVELGGNEAGDVLYTQDMWMALRGCTGKVLLAKNPGGQSKIIITLVDPTNVNEVCIDVRFCVSAYAVLYGQDEDFTTTVKNCGSEGGCCPGCRCWTTLCWDLFASHPVGIVGVTSIEIEFTDLPNGNEWWARGAYITTCPDYYIDQEGK